MISERMRLKSFGQLIAVQRHVQGKTQSWLAMKLGAKQSSICRMENGKQPISLDTAANIAELLHFDPQEFFK